MRISELFENEDEPARIKLGAGSAAAQAWIERVYAKYPQTMQNNHVMTWGSGDDLQFAMFELTPSFSKRGAVEVKWFQAYPLRQGVGSRAMKELQALAREDGISLTLFPWDKGQVSQSKLTKFYRGQGFAPGVKGGKAMQWTPDQPGVAEATEPTRGDLQQLIWNYFGQIYDHGDDDAREYLDRNGELFNKLMHKYNGEIADIVAREPTTVLMRVAQELKAVAGDLKYELDEQGVAEAETATQNSRQLAKEFRQLGYSQIGSGADATVWAKDDSYVIKILMPEDADSRAEQVFRKFYEFSMAHQDLACVPRFNEVNTIDINGKDYTQIEMERLAPIEQGTFMQGIVWLLSDYVTEQTPWPTIESELAMPDTWEMYSPNYADTLARTWQSLLENPAGRKTYAMYRQLYNVMKLLFTTGTINKFGWDLHTANVMRRNNGQPVIIDPWFSQGTS